ncbi:MAG: DNA-binding protein [Clostridium sp.]|nr:DNA-binding protein [Clostridium sp.]
MLLKQYDQGRLFLAKLDYQSDLLEELNRICREENIKTGIISAIGAVSSLKLGFYNQETKEYVLTTYAYDEPMEIVSCTGNISIKDGKPFCHVHVIAADKKGKCIGGHLVQGTSVFAGEVSVQELLGGDMIREEDEETGLTLWK